MPNLSDTHNIQLLVSAKNTDIQLVMGGQPQSSVTSENLR